MEILLAIFILIISYNVDLSNLKLDSTTLSKKTNKRTKTQPKKKTTHPPVKGNDKGLFDEKAFTYTYYKMKEKK